LGLRKLTKTKGGGVVEKMNEVVMFGFQKVEQNQVS
jgi:hypothetical protein